MIANYKNPASTQGLRNRIAELEAENAKLRDEIVATREKSADGLLVQKHAKECAAIHAHYQQKIAEFWAGCKKIDDELNAELAKRDKKS